VQNSFSQRSALFPWDDAGASSSISGAVLQGRQSSGKISVDHAETRMRGSSVSRRGSSLLSQHGEVFGGAGGFPVIINESPQLNDEDFVFNGTSIDSLSYPAI
jgi:meiotic recombination protein REC8, fungi type